MNWRALFGTQIAGGLLLLLSTALGTDVDRPDAARCMGDTSRMRAAAGPTAGSDAAATPGAASSGRTDEPTAADFSAAFERATERVLPSVVAIEVLERKPAGKRAPADRFSQPQPPGREDPKGSLKDQLDEVRYEHLPSQGKPPIGRDDRSKPRDDSDGPSDRDDRESIGSGVILDESGLVLTNHHVVDSQGEIIVRTSDGREFRVEQVWSDSRTDLAVLRLENPSQLTAAVLGDSDTVAIGQWVLAVGQPFGLESTVTAGIVSAKHRRVGLADRECYLQTDAAINPGNSGGPLVNLRGEVIGINTAISSRSGVNEGIGFAIPINLAKWVADQLANGGRVRRAYLGVTVQPVTSELAERLGIGPREGVVVADVAEGSPADQAGVQVGDVIVALGDDTVGSPVELQVLVERLPSGRVQELTVLRRSRRMIIQFTPATQGERRKEPEPRGKRRSPPAADFDRLGLVVAEREVSSDKGRRPQGVEVTSVEPDGPADQGGLEAGMIILQVDDQEIDGVEGYARAIAAAEGTAVLLLRTETGMRIVELTLED